MYTAGKDLDFFGPVLVTVNNVFAERLKDRKQRDNVVRALMLWLTTKARKKTVPDLDVRLRNIEERVKRLVENMRIEIEKDTLVVKASGSDEETLKMFRLGTSWFEANEDLMATILSGLFTE